MKERNVKQIKENICPRRRSKLEKYRQEKAAALAGTPKGMNVADDDYYKLIEVDELKYQLEVRQVVIHLNYNYIVEHTY
jgi:hypothetical protein